MYHKPLFKQTHYSDSAYALSLSLRQMLKKAKQAKSSKRKSCFGATLPLLVTSLVILGLTTFTDASASSRHTDHDPKPIPEEPQEELALDHLENEDEEITKTDQGQLEADEINELEDTHLGGSADSVAPASSEGGRTSSTSTSNNELTSTNTTKTDTKTTTTTSSPESPTPTTPEPETPTAPDPESPTPTTSEPETPTAPDPESPTAITPEPESSNTVAVISGDLSASLTEGDIGDSTIATGTISITDPDTGEANIKDTSTPTYGSFTLDEEGNWAYTLKQETVQSLSQDEILHDFIAITSMDGSKEAIIITINGTNDDPIIFDSTPLAVTNADIDNSFASEWDSSYTQSFEYGEESSSVTLSSDDNHYTFEGSKLRVFSVKYDTGDVNNDGIDDFIVGNYLATVNEAEYAGAAYVVFGIDSNADGTPDSFTVNLSNLDGSNGFSIQNSETAGYRLKSLGRSVSYAGDINNDGIGDIVIGSPYESNSSGSTYVIFGRETALSATFDIATLTPDAGFSLVLQEDSSEFGSTVSNVGDFNGDGIDDFLTSENEGEKAFIIPAYAVETTDHYM